MKKPFTYEEFKKIYSQVPRLTVDLIIRSHDGIILTLRSLPTWHNQWHLPGGTVLYKERIDDTVHRVAQEELDIQVKILNRLGNIEYPSEEIECGFDWSVGIAVLCESLSEKISINDEASRVEVFKELPENVISEQETFLKEHWDEIIL